MRLLRRRLGCPGPAGSGRPCGVCNLTMEQARRVASSGLNGTPSSAPSSEPMKASTRGFILASLFGAVTASLARRRKMGDPVLWMALIVTGGTFTGAINHWVAGQ